MASLKDRLKLSLDESRILIVAVQVLIGFNYESYLQVRFDKLPLSSQIANLGALALLVGSFAFIVSPAAFRGIVERGSETLRLLRFTDRRLRWTLAPLALALGIEVAVSLTATFAPLTSWIVGGAAAAVGIASWFLLGVIWAPNPVRHDTENRSEVAIKDQVNHVLTEARVVLPGAETLLGFQLITPLTAGFERLPVECRYIHAASLLLLVIATAMLIAPAAFHRMVEGGAETERLVGFASHMILGSLAFLALALAGDIYIVVWKVIGSREAASVAGGSVLLACYGLWFGYTTWLRFRDPANGSL